MRKLFTAAAICLTLLFTACDNPASNNPMGDITNGQTTLTIRNESAVTITNVTWNGIVLVDLGLYSTPGTRSLPTNVLPGNGFLHLTIADDASGHLVHSPRLRTQQLVLVEEGQQNEFVLLNSTLVVGQNNITSTLINAAPSPPAALTIRNESSHTSVISWVRWNDVDFTHGAAIQSGQSITRDVPAGNGYIRFSIFREVGPNISIRVEELLHIEAGAQKEFILRDGTIVRNEGNNTTGTLDGFIRGM